ncbi:MAG: purL, partial [Solirubrobacterales bacterium]|nr:purL [Solirubrobacterales bacterium]
ARAGDAIAIAGDFRPSLAASELAKLHGDPLPDGLPPVDIEAVRSAQAAIREGVRSGALSSAHDIAEGGLLVAVAEACMAGGLGAALDLAASDEPLVQLFGEGPGGFVVSGSRDALDALAADVPLAVIGTAGGDALEVTIAGEGFSASLEDLRSAHAALAPLFP